MTEARPTNSPVRSSDSDPSKTEPPCAHCLVDLTPTIMESRCGATTGGGIIRQSRVEVSVYICLPTLSGARQKSLLLGRVFGKEKQTLELGAAGLNHPLAG